MGAACLLVASPAFFAVGKEKGVAKKVDQFVEVNEKVSERFSYRNSFS